MIIWYRVEKPVNTYLGVMRMYNAEKTIQEGGRHDASEYLSVRT